MKLFTLTLTILFLLGGCSTVRSKRSIKSRISSYVGSAEELHPGRQTTVFPGTTVFIKLKKNSSTGYSWKYSISPAQPLTLAGSETFRSYYEEPRTGTPSWEVWKFTAREKGSVTLTYLYYRSWEGEKSAVITNVYSVKIE